MRIFREWSAARARVRGGVEAQGLYHNALAATRVQARRGPEPGQSEQRLSQQCQNGDGERRGRTRRCEVRGSSKGRTRQLMSGPAVDQGLEVCGQGLDRVVWRSKVKMSMESRAAGRSGVGIEAPRKGPETARRRHGEVCGRCARARVEARTDIFGCGTWCRSNWQ
jgi:hypothetical protein